MKPWNKLRLSTQSFGTKIFYLFALLIIIIYMAFSSFFIYSQSKILRSTLIEKGQSLADLLAHSSRLGVFAENEEMMKGPIEGAMQNREALLVQIFAYDNKKLKSLVRYEKGKAKNVRDEEDSHKSAIEAVKNSRSVLNFEKEDRIEFWAPVISDRKYTEDDLFFKNTPQTSNDNIIGFVKIILTTSVLNDNIRELLIKGILIPIFFLIPGGIIIYAVVKRITKPLIRLTEGVKAIEKGKELEKISVEATDEIGRLASAFNEMAESLKKRETEKEELEERLRQSQKMEAIGTLSGGIAHDFNNILSVIKSYGQLLKKKNTKNEDASRYLNHILSSAEKASALTRSLLAIGRKQIINPKPVNLSKIIRNVETILRRVLEEKILLTVELANENLIVTADSGCLELVLINLATNARDAMPEGGSLTVSLKTGEPLGHRPSKPDTGNSNHYAIISVADTGTGIDETIRERIFDPFFTTKEVGKGTGLGLSMVYGIINQHGGRIDVSSEPGKGTTFKIYIPLSDEIVAEDEAEELPEPEGGTETILLAEDNDDMRSLLKIVLKKHGYNVIEAVDGKEAVVKFAENRNEINLLLLDMIMPQRNGKAAYEEIKKMKHDVKALFMSGYSADTLKKGNFLSKPVSPDELLRKIREILDSQQDDIQKREA
jgi:signal transduction histidine kinase/ActR/RegA family two-component response regulator